MIVDAFLYYDELDLLEVRLRELDAVVDVFILVEATQTFSGRPKPAHFVRQRRDPRLQPYLHRIVHVIVDELPGESPRTREQYQRNQIARGLALLPELRDDDLLIVADVDEIPRAEAVALIRDTPDFRSRQGALGLTWYVHSLHCRVLGTHFGARVLPFGMFTNAAELRRLRQTFPDEYALPKAGWHCSYFGMGPAALRARLLDLGAVEQVDPEALSDERLHAAQRNCGWYTEDGFERVRVDPLDIPAAMRADPAAWGLA